MKSRTKNHELHLDKYDLFIFLVVFIAVISIAGAWLWYGHKCEQLQNEATRLSNK